MDVGLGVILGFGLGISCKDSDLVNVGIGLDVTLDNGLGVSLDAGQGIGCNVGDLVGKNICLAVTLGVELGISCNVSVFVAVGDGLAKALVAMLMILLAKTFVWL